MVFDQSQSPRLGQRTTNGSTFVQMFSSDELPEAAWTGQLIYRNEDQILQIFNGNAWEDVSGGDIGQLTFVGSTVPTAQHQGDMWFDSGDNNRMYVAHSPGANQIAAGQWEIVSAAAPPLTPTTYIYHQDTAPGPADSPPPKNNDFWYETPYNHQYYYSSLAPGTHWIGVKDTGIDTAQATADASVKTTSNEYAVSASETVAPSTGWSTTTPARTPGTFTWFRTITTLNNGTSSTSNPALLTGNTGLTGPSGGQGVPGPPGSNGQPLYTWVKYADSPTSGMSDDPTNKAYLGLAYNKTTITESSLYTDYQWTKTQGSPGTVGDPGVPGPPGPNGQPTYTWIKYGTSSTGAGLTDFPAGMTYMGIAYNKTTSVEGTDPTAYEWSLIQGPQGIQGSQGVQGPRGADGQPLYTWLKYADTPTTGMSDLPAGKVYMGVSYNQASALESTNYNDYAWSLIQGPQGNQGIAGPTGANGQPTYTWIKYATSITGAGLTDSPGTNPYIGFAYNKTTPTESTIPTDYEWSLIQGPQGVQGIQGPQGSQGVQGPQGPNGQILYTWIKYADTPTTGMTDLPAGKAYMGISYNHPSPTESTLYTDYDWSLILGPQGNTGVQGPAGANGAPTYTWIKYADSITGTGLSDSSVGKAYIGLAYNKSSATESTLTTDYEWSLIQGPQGPAGTPASTITLTTPAQTLIGPVGGAAGATVPATSVVTGTVVGPTSITIREYSTDGGVTWTNLTSPPAYITVDAPNNKVTITGATMPKSVAIRMGNGTISDLLTVNKIWDGAQGGQGSQGDPGAVGRGVTGTTVTYQMGTSATTAPTGTWVSSPPTILTGQYLWSRTVTSWSAAPVTTGPVDTMVGGGPGASGGNGADGRGITGTTVEYQLSSSGVLPAPNGTWVANPPTITPGNYLWTRTTTTFSALPSPILSYSISAAGANGSNGNDGNPGRGITSTAVDYLAGSSGTVAPTGTWVSSPPVVTAGQFLWTRTYTNWSAAPTQTGPVYNVAPAGNDGQTGRGITGTVVDYQNHTQGVLPAPTGTWSPSPPATPAGQFLWTRTMTNWSVAPLQTGPVYVISSAGTNGSNGNGVTSTNVDYATSASGTVAPSTGWVASPIPIASPGQFLWARTTTHYTSTADTVTYAIAPAGTNGSNGNPGRGISTTASDFQVSNSGTAPPGSTGWTVSPVPVANPGQFLWTRTITTYTDALNPTTAYTVAPAGANGNDAYTVQLSNQAAVFPGTTTAAVVGNTATGTVTVFKGTTPISSTITPVAATGLTASAPATGTTPAYTFTTAAGLALTGQTNIGISADGKSFTGVFSWSVGLQGAQGSTGSTGGTGAPGANAPTITSVTPYFAQVAVAASVPAKPVIATPPAPWVSTEPAYAVGTVLYRCEKTLLSDASFTYSNPTLVSTYQAVATDGLAPTGSVVPTVTRGLGAIYLRWTPVTNHDPVVYDIHVSPITGFTPSSITLATTTAGISYTLRELPTPVVQPVGGDPAAKAALLYGQPYYFRIQARDADGAGPMGAESPGCLVAPVSSNDIDTNTITGDNIAGNTITGDLFDSTLILGSTISTGGLDSNGNLVGARVDLGPKGITTYAPDGLTPVVNFPLDPTDDAFIHNAHVSLLSADVADNLTVSGKNNELAASSTLQLGAGITSPQTPPTCATAYVTVQLDTTTKLDGGTSMGSFALDPSQITSMCWDQIYSCWQIWQQKPNGFRLWRFNVDGSITTHNTPAVPWFEDWAGANIKVSGCRSGWLFQYSNIWYVWSTIEGGGRYGIIPSSWIIAAGTSDPFLSYDETTGQFMLCQMSSNTADVMVIQRFHTVPYVSGNFQPCVANGAPINSPLTVQKLGKITGCFYGTADFGGLRYVSATDAYTMFNVWTTSTLYNGASNYAQWTAPMIAKAFAWDGGTGTVGHFWSVDASGKMYQYTNWTWTTEPSTTWVGLSAYDSNATGGTHETPVGAMANRNAARRALLTITVPPTHADPANTDAPDQFRVYWARTSGAVPTVSQLHYVSALGNQNNYSAVTPMSADSTGFNPPQGVIGQGSPINTFPGGNAAQILDGAGNVLADAKGHGAVGITGEIRMYSGPAVNGSPTTPPPPGWLVCDGSSQAKSAYQDLSNLIGTTFGVGTNSPAGTTFSLPNLMGRFPMGAGATTPTVGTTGGQANMSQHTHGSDHVHNAVNPSPWGGQTGNLNTANDGHNHPYDRSTASGTATSTVSGGTGTVAQSGSVGMYNPTSYTHNHAVTGHTASTNQPNTDQAGSGTIADENRPPFLAIIFIIRT